MTGIGRAAPRPTAGAGTTSDAAETLVLPPRQPRVAGYLRFILGSPFPVREDVLRATAAERGYLLVTVVRSTGVSTLTGGCPGIGEILRLIDEHEIDGVLTLADYTIAWDQEVVRRIAERIRQRSAFLDYVWPRPPQRHRPTPNTTGHDDDNRHR